MKKLFLALLAVFSIALVVAGCGGDSKPAANSGDKKVVLKVGATPVPHAEILNLIKPQLAKEGVDLQIIEFSDYVKPNLSLADKELDATSSSTLRISRNLLPKGICLWLLIPRYISNQWGFIQKN